LGGHSGDDIDKGHANSNKFAARIAERGARLFGAKLAHFDGGNLRNAIPREAYIILGVPSAQAEEFVTDAKAFAEALCAEFALVEKGAKIAQMVIAPCTRAEIVETDEVDDTVRGTGGFGSSGLS
jgi:dipeptidase D